MGLFSSNKSTAAPATGYPGQGGATYATGNGAAPMQQPPTHQSSTTGGKLSSLLHGSQDQHPTTSTGYNTVPAQTNHSSVHHTHGSGAQTGLVADLKAEAQHLKAGHKQHEQNKHIAKEQARLAHLEAKDRVAAAEAELKQAKHQEKEVKRL